MQSNKPLIITPQNDLESVAIKGYAERNGVECVVTNQGWGAGYKEIEPEVLEKIDQALKDGRPVYGIELQGSIPGVTNVDHHSYWGNDKYAADDRTKDADGNLKPSAIEQVAKIVGEPLTVKETFIAVNDSGFVYGMEDYAKGLDMPREEVKALIQEVRREDRRAQGLDEKAENELLDYANEHKCVDGQTTIVELPYSKCAPITDTMYDSYTTLVCIGQDNELNIFSTDAIIKDISEHFGDVGGWSGAGAFGQNFYGTSDISYEKMAEIAAYAAQVTKETELSAPTEPAVEEKLSLDEQIAAVQEDMRQEEATQEEKSSINNDDRDEID